MGRRSTAEAVLPSPGIAERARKAFRFTVGALLITIGLLAAAITFWKVEEFLIYDTRFLLPGPPEPGEKSAFFRMEGIENAAEEQLVNVFARDFGRSIYLLPLKERRLNLLAVDWVKDATVSKVWPNRVTVHITERKPVAFVQNAVADGSLRYGLIDEDGVLLMPQRAFKSDLAVLTGMPASENEPARRERVRRFMKMQQELGPLMANISEVDISDIDNLQATQMFDSRALVLMLGNQQYRQRLENFLNNADEIRRGSPGASRFDLRLKGRVIAIGDSQDVR